MSRHHNNTIAALYWHPRLAPIMAEPTALPHNEELKSFVDDEAYLEANQGVILANWTNIMQMAYRETYPPFSAMLVSQFEEACSRSRVQNLGVPWVKCMVLEIMHLRDQFHIE